MKYLHFSQMLLYFMISFELLSMDSSENKLKNLAIELIAKYGNKELPADKALKDPQLLELIQKGFLRPAVIINASGNSAKM